MYYKGLLKGLNFEFEKMGHLGNTPTNFEQQDHEKTAIFLYRDGKSTVDFMCI